MEKELENLLKKANGALDKAIEMSPQLIESYIQYKITWLILEPIILLLLITSFVFLVRRFLRSDKDFIHDIWFFGKYGEIGSFFSWAILGITSLFFVISLVTSIHDLILINISKEVYLINNFIK